MKKVLIAILSVVLLAIGYDILLGATGAPNRSIHLSVTAQNDKIKIKAEELPEPIKKALQADAYKNWQIISAYKLKNEDYQVELKKGDTTQTITFDKDGKSK